VDENIHEGWNYYTWKEASEYPGYRYYRFSGTKKNSCKINEIKFTGVQTMKSELTTHQCTPKLFIGGVDASDKGSLAQVSYVA